MSPISSASQRTLWLGLMTAASTGTSLLLACATPYPALAALAGAQARRTDSMLLIILAWAAAQLAGFALVGPSRDAGSHGWSIALLMAATGSLLAAQAGARIGAPWGRAGRLIAGYVAAYIGFKAVVLLWTLLIGADCAAFAPHVLARQFARNGLILIGLVIVDRLVARAGIAPAAAPARA